MRSGQVPLAAERGYRVVVIGRRGAQQPLKAPKFNLFGDEAEHEVAISKVEDIFPGAPLFLYGVSSGTKLVINLLARFDTRRASGKRVPNIRGGVCISPGYDLRNALLNFRFQLVLDYYYTHERVENGTIAAHHKRGDLFLVDALAKAPVMVV